MKIIYLCFIQFCYEIKKTEQGKEKVFSLSLKGSIGMNKLGINIEWHCFSIAPASSKQKQQQQQ